MQPIPYTVNKAQHAYMKMRQGQNRAICVSNPNENWMAGILATTGYKWTRQAGWGFRLFDFWNHLLGVAVEVDGPEHAKSKDAQEDEYNFRRSAIIVLHVKNRCESDAANACRIIAQLPSWQARRAAHGNQTDVDDTQQLLKLYLASL